MRYILGALLLVCSLPALAQHQKPTPPWFVERFRLSAGAFFPINNTTIQVGRTDGSGTTLDFEDDLGFNRHTFTFLADFQWRASRRSRFDLTYFRLARNANRSLDRTIEFGEHTYPVNADVHAFFNTDIIRFSYGYALYTSPRAEAGLSIGAHTVNADVGLSLVGNTAALDVRDDYGFTAPLPNVGIWGGYAINDKWALNLEFDYLSLTVNDVKGRILAGTFNVQYRILPMLSASAGFTGLNFKVEAEKKRLWGDLQWGYNGPTLTAIYTFGKKKW
ncbi:hypothetical protein ACWKWU_12900 [Chitinophaga lutea]